MGGSSLSYNFMSTRYPLALRQEVFQKVERQYMLGLRAKDPKIRHRFFLLYHDSLGKTLFLRLQYIIQFQDWEAVSDVFWLKQGLDLLLAILVENEPINLAPNSARVPPIMVSGPFPDRSGIQQQISEIPDCPEGAPITFEFLVARHAQFLNEMSKLQVFSLVFLLLFQLPFLHVQNSSRCFVARLIIVVLDLW